MKYVPRLIHAITTAALGFAAIFFGGLYLPETQMFWVGFAGLIFIGYSGIVMVWISNRERIALYEAMTQFGDMMTRLSEDQWHAVGIKFPVLRIRWQGKPILMFEDTGVTLKQFEAFLSDSNQRYVSPKRNWQGVQRQRTWSQIMSWLETNKYIYEDSSAGQHSWLWRGDAHKLLMERYIYSTLEVHAMPEQAKPQVEAFE